MRLRLSHAKVGLVCRCELSGLTGELFVDHVPSFRMRKCN